MLFLKQFALSSWSWAATILLSVSPLMFQILAIDMIIHYVPLLLLLLLWSYSTMRYSWNSNSCFHVLGSEPYYSVRIPVCVCNDIVKYWWVNMLYGWAHRVVTGTRRSVWQCSGLRRILIMSAGRCSYVTQLSRLTQFCRQFSFAYDVSLLITKEHEILVCASTNGWNWKRALDSVSLLVSSL
jgi:hypothetical protein